VTSNRVARALLAVAVVSASRSDALTRCVKPGGAGGCFAVIQDAVTASGPGDVVSIGPGVYFENVTVLPGREGMQIVGAGKTATIIDPDVPNAGNGIIVNADGVVVRNLGIRNGQFAGIGVAGNDVVIQGVRVVGVRGSGSIGIQVDIGTRVQLLSNEIRAVDNRGIFVGGNGPDVLVSGNTVTQTPTAIQVNAATPRVIGNKVAGGSQGIIVAGVQAVVEGNVIEQCGGGFGLVVSGQNPTVRKNKLVNAGDVLIECNPCSGGLASGNTSLGSRGQGLHVSADAPGFVVQANSVSRARGAAYELFGASIQATANTAIDTGVHPNGDCFLTLAGDGHVFSGNKATRCGRAGYFIDADGVTLEGNTATQAGTDGFVVTGSTGSTVTANKALSSNAAGVALFDSAVGTSLSGNLASGNRYGLCGSGTGTVLGQNSLGAPPTSTVCDVTQ
jgi:parallel beta-helix repeat protein